jgi:hypothetical protein
MKWRYSTSHLSHVAHETTSFLIDLFRRSSVELWFSFITEEEFVNRSSKSKGKSYTIWKVLVDFKNSNSSDNLKSPCISHSELIRFCIGGSPSEVSDSDSSKYSEEFCTSIAEHLMHAHSLPAPCLKYAGIVSTLNKKEKDSAHPTQWLS